MDCRTAIEYINLYADDMLNNKEETQLLSHIGSCSKCKKDLDDTLAVKKALAGLSDVKPPAGLAIAAIRKAKKRKLPVFAYASAGVAAAIALVAIFSSSILKSPGNIEQPKLAASAVYSEALADGAAPKEESAAGAQNFAFAGSPDATAMPAAENEAYATRDVSGSYIYVPAQISEKFRESLEKFLIDNSIEYKYIGDDNDIISFMIPEDKLEDLKSLIDVSFKGYAYKDEETRYNEELKAGPVNFIFK